MASCERCWADANGNGGYGYYRAGGRVEYADLVKIRNGVTERECTPEEQAGPGATECPKCYRKTMHQICRDTCMNPACGFVAQKGEER